MENYFKYFLGIVFILTITGCGDGNSRPSINDNSVNRIDKKQRISYSNIDSKDLLEHIEEHYNLGEYIEGKQKLIFLTETYTSGSFNGVNLIELKSKFDEALSINQKKKQILADSKKKERIPSVINKMRKVKEGENTFYYDKSSPEFDIRECFYAYVKKGPDGVQMFFKSRYVGAQSLGLHKIMVTVDQLDYFIEGKVEKTTMKGKNAFKRELMEVEITTQDQLETLKAIASGTDVMALLIGKGAYRKKVIKKEQRNAFRNIIDVYTYLGGDKIISFSEEFAEN